MFKNRTFWIGAYIRCAAVSLVTTGLIKLASATGSASILQSADPVLYFNFRSTLILAGIVELGIGAICLIHKGTLLCSALIAWIATIFCAYRFCLMISGYHRPCPCLGNLTDAMKIPPYVADATMKILLVYLLVGGYGLVINRTYNKAKGRSI